LGLLLILIIRPPSWPSPAPFFHSFPTVPSSFWSVALKTLVWTFLFFLFLFFSPQPNFFATFPFFFSFLGPLLDGSPSALGVSSKPLPPLRLPKGSRCLAQGNVIRALYPFAYYPSLLLPRPPFPPSVTLFLSCIRGDAWTLRPGTSSIGAGVSSTLSVFGGRHPTQTHAIYLWSPRLGADPS